MSMWGHCGVCSRWFPCAGWFDRRKPAPVCPSCGGSPDVVESRAGDLAVSHEPVRAMPTWGLCPSCRGWFAADAWFDDSAPLPCCPDCGMSPSRLTYGEPPDPVVTERHSSAHQEYASSERWIG